MKVEFKRSFVRDLKRVRDRDLKERIAETIEKVEEARSLQDVGQVKMLQGSERCYRIRVRDYRLGLVLEGNTVSFIRLLHRRDIYRHFP